MSPVNEVFNSNYFATFEAARGVPHPIIQYYLWLLFPSPLASFLDVGSGTGQFALVARSHFTNDCTILEPAQAALSQLQQTVPDAKFLNCEFEKLPDSSSKHFDAILLSEVIHLISLTPFEFVAHLQLNLSRGGRALIRTSSSSQLKTRTWYDMFPAARALDLQRHVDLDELEVAVQAASDLTIRRVTVDESRWINRDTFLQWFERRAFSTLRLIDSDDYARGMTSLRSALSSQTKVWHDYVMTAVIIERSE